MSKRIFKLYVAPCIIVLQKEPGCLAPDNRFFFFCQRRDDGVGDNAFIFEEFCGAQGRQQLERGGSQVEMCALEGHLGHGPETKLLAFVKVLTIERLDRGSNDLQERVCNFPARARIPRGPEMFCRGDKRNSRGVPSPQTKQLHHDGHNTILLRSFASAEREGDQLGHGLPSLLSVPFGLR